MKKFKKLLLITSLATMSLSLIACSKDKDENDGSNALNNLMTQISTEETTEEITTAEVTTEEITTEMTTEVTTEEVKEERASYIITDEIDTASIPTSAVEASETNPAKQGEWTAALKTIGTDKPRQTLYFRTTDVKRGEEAMNIIREYEANDGDFKFGDLEYDDLEYCVMTYQVYFPEDYQEGDYGISFTNLAFHVVDGDNHGTIGNYIGMAQTYDISERVKGGTLYAGDVIERQMVFVMVKDYTDYMLYYSYYDDDHNEFVKYIACEAVGTDSTSNSNVANTTTNNSTTTEASNTNITTDDLSSKTNTIEDGVYKVTNVRYSDGTIATKEQIENAAGQPFNVYFTVIGDTCLFDASGAGDGLGRASGTITQDGDNFTFTDGGGNVFNCVWIADSKTIEIPMGETVMIFEPYES